MLLMKESVLSFEEKTTTQPLFSYLQIAGNSTLGAICNRWKVVARRGLSLSVRTLYHWATHQQLFTLTLPGYTKTVLRLMR